jgi:hypothetical protein
MKHLKLRFALIFTAAGSILTGCESSDKKIEDALQHVTEAKTELKNARMDSVAEYEMVRAEWISRLAANEKKLAELKTKIAREKKQVQEKYQAELEAIGKKNAEMQEKMNGMARPDKDRWEIFKKELDMTLVKLTDDLSKVAKVILEVGEK